MSDCNEAGRFKRCRIETGRVSSAAVLQGGCLRQASVQSDRVCHAMAVWTWLQHSASTFLPSDQHALMLAAANLVMHPHCIAIASDSDASWWNLQHFEVNLAWAC